MTEQEKYGIEQLSEYLEMQIRIKDGRIKRYKEQMDSDFLYYFAWAGKDLFKEHYMVGKYKELRQILKEAESPEAVQDYLQRERGKCLEKLVDGEIYTHYSEDIFNLAHSYKTECRQQLIRGLQRVRANSLDEVSPKGGESKNRAGNNEKEVERIKNVKHETGQLEY